MPNDTVITITTAGTTATMVESRKNSAVRRVDGGRTRPEGESRVAQNKGEKWNILNKVRSPSPIPYVPCLVLALFLLLRPVAHSAILFLAPISAEAKTLSPIAVGIRRPLGCHLLPYASCIPCDVILSSNYAGAVDPIFSGSIPNVEARTFHRSGIHHPVWSTE